MSASRRSWLRVGLGLLVLLCVALMVLLLWRARTPVGTRAADAGAAVSQADAGGGPRRARARTTALQARDERLTLAGRVLFLDGKPVPNAAVSLSGAATAQVRANARGEFVFGDLLVGSYVVDASSEDGAAAPVRVHLTGDTSGIVLRIGPAAGLTVWVLDARDDRPIPRATVELRTSNQLHEPRTVRTGETDGNGKVFFRGLKVDGYAIGAWARGYRGHDWFVTPAYGLAWEHVFRLERGGDVSGKVVTERGAPVAGALVQCLPADGAGRALISRPRAWPYMAASGPDGKFTISGVKPGTLRVYATHDRHPLSWSEPFTFDGASRHDGVVVTMQRGGAIAGRVVAPGGAPVARAQVRLTPTDIQKSGLEVRNTTTNERGEFVVEGLPLTTMMVAAMVDGAASETQAVDLEARAEQRSLELVLDSQEEIAGVVVDTQGRPVEYATVLCVCGDRNRAAEIGLRPIAVETADAEGGFACRGLVKGTYMVRAERPFASNNIQPGLRAAFKTKVPTGTLDVRLELPRDGAVRGVVLQADGRAPPKFGVSLNSAHKPRPVDNREGGAFLLDGLPPGTYTLSVYLGGAVAATREVTVKEGETVDLGTVTVAGP